MENFKKEIKIKSSFLCQNCNKCNNVLELIRIAKLPKILIISLQKTNIETQRKFLGLLNMLRNLQLE